MQRDLKILVKFEALDRLMRPMKSINREGAAVAKRLKDTRDEVTRLNKASRDIASLRKLREDMRGAGNAADEQRRKMKELSAQLSAGAAAPAKLRREYEKAKKAAAALDAQQREQVSRFTALKTKIQAAGLQVRTFADAEVELKRRLDGANNSLDEQKRKMADLAARSKRMQAGQANAAKISQAGSNLAVGGASSLSAGIAVGAPALGAVKGAMTYESAMANVRKVVNASDAAMRALNDQLLELSTRLPISADALANMAAEAARNRVAFKDLAGFTEDAAKLKVAFDFETAEQAAETLMAWRNSLTITQPEAMKLANQVNALTNAYGGNNAEVAAVIQDIGSLAKTAGVGNDAVAALAQTLNMKGVGSDVAGTGIQNLLLRLSQGAATVPKAQKALQALGLDAVKVAKDMQTDGKGTILDVLERIAKLPKDQQTAALTQIFGRESIQAIAALLADLPQLRNAFALVADQQKVNGSVAREFAARMGTSENEVQLGINGLLALGTVLGTMVLPQVVLFSRWVGETSAKMRAWVKEHPTLGKGLMLLVGALSGLLIVGGGLGIMIGGLLAPFAALAVVSGATGVALLPLLGTILAIVLLIGLVGVAIYGLVKAFDFLKANWGNFMAWLGENLGAIDAWVMKWSNFGEQLINGFIGGIRRKLGELKSTIVGVGANATAWFKEKLGINSPSRVFAQLGVHTMSGLAQGIDKGARGPLDSAALVAARLTAAVAMGTAPMAAAAATPGAQGGQGGNTYVFNITANTKADAKAIADEIRKIIGGGGPGAGSAAFADQD